jgi:hypothetical protein
MNSLSRTATALATVSFSICLTSTAQAQSNGTIRSIRRYTVKTERAGDMAAAIKEANAIYKKAGMDKSISIWRSLTGPTELVRVDYYEKFADLDAGPDPKLAPYAAEMARITARIVDSFAKSDRVIDIVMPNLSLPRTAAPPKMLMVWTAVVKPGKIRELLDLERDEFLPAMKNAGVQSYTFARTRFGGPDGEVRSATGLNSWADLDGSNPIRKGMGEEKYTAYVAKVSPLFQEYRYEVFRFDAELSYVPAK